jgi:hypothetical protein
MGKHCLHPGGGQVLEEGLKLDFLIFFSHLPQSLLQLHHLLLELL